jgi:hypothetical protein
VFLWNVTLCSGKFNIPRSFEGMLSFYFQGLVRPRRPFYDQPTHEYQGVVFLRKVGIILKLPATDVTIPDEQKS